MAALQSPQPPPIEAVLTALINEIAAISPLFVLVLDDYHLLIEAQPIHDALAFLLDHLPPQMHLVIATRADPPLPIARLRARGQLTELRLLAATSALLEFVFAPIWGGVSDRTGRKPILMLGMLGYALSLLLFGLSTQLWTFSPPGRFRAYSHLPH